MRPVLTSGRAAGGAAALAWAARRGLGQRAHAAARASSSSERS